eukprot:TRINITY_DN618_c0_g1_i5.p2 TRINITY_DN618_c0_g1~~TRINITY_DN618_c0_g1_i5.p2  ORF type:complete len:174 (+),score=60.34 TRINITY_DN618_c0_g1_i5:61-582(+)
MCDPGTDLVTCPYNIAHSIQRRRFDNHLMKCSKNYPNIKLMTCKFNTKHRIKAEDHEKHMMVCEDKAAHDARILQARRMNSIPVTKVHIQDNKPQDLDDDEEDWGLEAQRNPNTYNPTEAAANKNVIRTSGLKNATPSERKLFRKQEKERLERIEQEQNGGGSQNNIPGLNYK